MTTVLERVTAPRDFRAEVVEDRTPSAKRRLEQVVAEPGFGRVEWERPGPSAAFSRRDSSSPGFAHAVEAVREAATALLAELPRNAAGQPLADYVRLRVLARRR